MKFIIIVLFISITFIGCKKVFFEEGPKNTPENNFEVFWKDFDRNYPQFVIRRINWDSVYLIYRSQITPQTTNIHLYNVLSEMVNTMNDMHVCLYTPYGSASWKSKSLGKYPSNKLINICHYLNCDNYQRNSVFGYGSFKDNTIGYIIINSFGGDGTGLNITDSRYSFIDDIIEKFKDKEGIIIDVRYNNGGELYNAMEVASRFADEKRWYAKFSIKKGPGKNDLSDWQNQYVEPSGNFQYKKPVVVITSRSTCSAAEQFVLAMGTFPYVTIVGDTTGGGFGFPMYRELPNGWSYCLSTSIGATPDGYIIEGQGVTPDITVQTSVADSVNNIDRLIEKSIDILKMKNM